MTQNNIINVYKGPNDSPIETILATYALEGGYNASQYAGNGISSAADKVSESLKYFSGNRIQIISEISGNFKVLGYERLDENQLDKFIKILSCKNRNVTF